MKRLLPLACLTLAFSLAHGQAVSPHTVEGGQLIQGTAMTYDAPKGWSVKTELNPNTYYSICTSPDNAFAYMIVSSIPNAFTLGGPPGTPQQTGTPPPQSLLDYLTNFLTVSHVGKITKVIEKQEKPIAATMAMQGSNSLGRKGCLRVLFTDQKDGKTHEGMLGCEIQMVSNRFNRLITGTWIVNNFFFVAGPQGELAKAGTYFTKCMPTYQFTDEYVQALNQTSQDNIHRIGRIGKQNSDRINQATEQMVSNFKQYMRE